MVSSSHSISLPCTRLYGLKATSLQIRSSLVALKSTPTKISQHITRFSQGMTPLHRAPSKEVVEALISNGADVNVKDVS